MTRDRIYGEDSHFSGWLRRNRNLPSSEIVATDADMMMHRYKHTIDGIGSREIQGIILIEAKTRNAEPSASQRDTLWKIHQTINRRPVHINKTVVRNFGVAFLSMSNTDPSCSDRMRWGRFDRHGSIDWRQVQVAELEALLRFDRHPDTFERNAFRRHHKTRQLLSVERQPLGFVAEVLLTHRS